MYKEFFKELDTPIYQASYRLTQNDSGSNNVVFNIRTTNGTRLNLSSLVVKFPNLTTGSSMSVLIKDSGDNYIQNLATGLSMDNNFFVFPHAGNYTTNNETSSQTITLTNGDYLNVTVYNLEENGTYDVNLRGFIRGRPPTNDTTGSGATPAITTNYSRIV